VNQQYGASNYLVSFAGVRPWREEPQQKNPISLASGVVFWVHTKNDLLLRLPNSLCLERARRLPSLTCVACLVEGSKPLN
jgi:hypothetical protein